MLAGYYGFDNLGDELILDVWVRQLKARGCDITVLSHRPEETARRFGVASISRLDVLDLMTAFSQADWLIFGGGGLFQDSTGLGSPLYYGGLAFMAELFSVPVLFWNQGVGPLRHPVSQWVTQRALRAAQSVTVRDVKSCGLVTQLTGVRPPQTADPVWLAQLPPGAEVDPRRRSRQVWRLGLSLRPHKDLTESRLHSLAYFFKHLIGQKHGQQGGVEILLLPFQPGGDQKILKRFAQMVDTFGGFAQCVLVEPDKVQLAIPHCHALFGMRFHSLVLGMLAQVPVYGLVYDPKVRHLLDGLHLAGTDIADLNLLSEEVVRQYFGSYQFPDLTWLRSQADLSFELLDELMIPYSLPV